MAHDRCQPYQSPSARHRGSRRQSGYGQDQRGLNSKIHLAVDAKGMPVRIFNTAGTVNDCKQACALIDSFSAEWLFADRGYDSSEIVEKAISQNMKVVIPPRKNRNEQQDYDKNLYKLRLLVENAFLWPKRWRGIATRYAKSTASFVAVVQIRCIPIWASVLSWLLSTLSSIARKRRRCS